MSSTENLVRVRILSFVRFNTKCRRECRYISWNHCIFNVGAAKQGNNTNASKLYKIYY